MIIHKISNTTNNVNFGMKFKLSDETLNAISMSTKLSTDELKFLPLNESAKLMKERGSLKEPSKLKQWLSNQYIKFGERFGLVEKHHNIYPYEF